MYASGGSASITYGKGWEIDTSSGSSIYATIADVDAHRDGCVNPAVGTGEELEKMEAFNTAGGKSIRDEKPTAADDTPEALDCYDKINLKNPVKASATKSEIAVIEVHQNFHSTDEMMENLQDEYGLPACRLASARNISTANRCDDCNIERPPRRTDEERGYDNNVGVKRYQK